MLYKWVVKGRDCRYTNTVTKKNRKAKPVIFIPSFAKGGKEKKNQTRGKYRGKLLTLCRKLWRLHNTPPYPQTWPSGKVTTPNNFFKTPNSIMMHQTVGCGVFFFFSFFWEFQVSMSSVSMKCRLYSFAFDFKDKREWARKIKETPK